MNPFLKLRLFIMDWRGGSERACSAPASGWQPCLGCGGVGAVPHPGLAPEPGHTSSGGANGWDIDPHIEFICTNLSILIDFHYKIEYMFLQGRKMALEVKSLES